MNMIRTYRLYNIWASPETQESWLPCGIKESFPVLLKIRGRKAENVFDFGSWMASQAVASRIRPLGCDRRVADPRGGSN